MQKKEKCCKFFIFFKAEPIKYFWLNTQDKIQKAKTKEVLAKVLISSKLNQSNISGLIRKIKLKKLKQKKFLQKF